MEKLQTLQPLKPYVDASDAVWKRQRRLTGPLFGGVMATTMHYWLAPSESGTGAMIIAVVVFVSTGTVFGFTWSEWMAASTRKWTVRAYEGSPPFAIDIPAGDFSYRLPASLLVSDRMAGGVAFLGPGTIVFVPHGANLPAHRQIVRIQADGDLRVDTVMHRSTVMRRLLVGQLPPLMRVSAGRENWRFLVPLPEDTARKVRDIVAADAPSVI